MEKITRKEAFECAIAQKISIWQILNNGKEKLYDYALILMKGSLSPIVCLKPGDMFQWNDDVKKDGQKSYAFVPVGNSYLDLIHLCGNNAEEYGRTVTFEKLKAIEHPASWIREALTYKYLKLSYFTGVLIENELIYDDSYFSKKHSTWIRYQEDETIIYFPYYTSAERKKTFEGIASHVLKKIYDEYWND